MRYWLWPHGRIATARTSLPRRTSAAPDPDEPSTTPGRFGLFSASAESTDHPLSPVPSTQSGRLCHGDARLREEVEPFCGGRLNHGEDRRRRQPSSAHRRRGSNLPASRSPSSARDIRIGAGFQSSLSRRDDPQDLPTEAPARSTASTPAPTPSSDSRARWVTSSPDRPDQPRGGKPRPRTCPRRPEVRGEDLVAGTHLGTPVDGTSHRPTFWNAGPRVRWTSERIAGAASQRAMGSPHNRFRRASPRGLAAEHVKRQPLSGSRAEAGSTT